MNPRETLNRFEKFAEEFGGILEVASDHCFMQNDYHLLLFQVLFQRIAESFKEEKQPFVLSEIPTGCGKSWVLAILAAAIRQKFQCNVLIATSTNFLAKYGEEHYGIQFELTYNMPTNSYVSFPKLVDIVTDLHEPTFLLIDEIDNFLFSNPLATRANGGCEDNLAVFKAGKLNNSNVLGVLGVTGTLDSLYGVTPLKNMFSDFFFLKTPTLKNQDITVNYKSGMKKGEYSSERADFEKDIKEAVKEFASNQPVIVIVEDENEAIMIQ